MQASSYSQRRGQLEAYFDRTAADDWRRLTSDAPVGRIRSTVRAGRDEMRNTILGWLPGDLSGKRVLDAGCGTGAMAVELAERGAEVVAIDLSPTLVVLARERIPESIRERIDFRVGDMVEPALGKFDHVVAMDSFIHYRAQDMLKIVSTLAERTIDSIVFTFAPRTMPLALMHAAGKLFPKGNRSPAIEPIAERALLRKIAGEPGLTGWRAIRRQRIARGFYISNALEICRSPEVAH